MARPRTVTDEAILSAAMALMYAHGPEALTYAAVGKAVGLSAATLVQRFPTRDAFMEAAFLQSWDELDARTAVLDRTVAISADGAIEFVLALIPADLGVGENLQGLALLREDMRNPVLRARGVAWRQALARALGRRLTAVSSEQERLGRMFASQWQGAQIWWGFDQSNEPRAAIGAELRDWCQAMLK